eukprot:contig_19784_g4878
MRATSGAPPGEGRWLVHLQHTRCCALLRGVGSALAASGRGRTAGLPLYKLRRGHGRCSVGLWRHCGTCILPTGVSSPPRIRFACL